MPAIDQLNPPIVDQRRTNASVEGQLVYAIGDVRGCYGLLREILATIKADCDARARGRRPILVFLGNYVGRGPDSRNVLEAMVWLQRNAELKIRTLMGSHEQCLLSFLDDPQGSPQWLEHGGVETLNSYCIDVPRSSKGSGLVRARDEFLDAMPTSHHRFLESLETLVSIGDFAFVHAGIRPGIAINKQAVEDLLWITDDFLTVDTSFQRVIVHGHSGRSDRPEILGNRICIDTGADETGVLTAICLEDEQLTIMQVRA